MSASSDILCRLGRSIRPLVALLVASVVAVVAASEALGAPAALTAPSGYAVVRPVAGQPIQLYERPGGRVVASLSRSELGGPLVLGVVRRAGPWLAVTAEALPNGRVGWIDERTGVATSRVYEAIHVDLSERQLELYRRGRLVRRVTVAIGAPSSPTPTGRYAVAEKLPGAPYGPSWGCCILGLTAHQPNPPAGWNRGLTYFVAIHGGGGIGASVSAGCLHLAEPQLRFVMNSVPLGAPVFVTR